MPLVQKEVIPTFVPPGRTCLNYKPDEKVFKHASVPHGSVKAREDVIDTLKNDYLELKQTPWNISVTQNKGGYKHSKEAATDKLSSTYAPNGISLMSTDASHKAVRAARLEQTAETTRKVKSIAFDKPADSTGWSITTVVAKRQMEEGLATTTKKALENTSRQTRTIKPGTYKPPWKVQEEAMATTRAKKAAGEWPAPPPQVEVLAHTKYSRTRPKDMQEVLDLDDFHPPGSEWPSMMSTTRTSTQQTAQQ